MPKITIKHSRTGQALFSGDFLSLRDATEAAIADNISLACADLRHANLVNAHLDGAMLDGVQLDEANLMGANISEASLCRACLTNTQLHNAVLCETILNNTDCRGAIFGGTDISNTQIKHCRFDTLSALDLDFSSSKTMDKNSFVADSEYLCAFSRPPLVLHGLSMHVACFDHALMIGHHAFTTLPTVKMPDIPSRLFSFIAGHRDLLEHLWHGHSDQVRKAA